MSVMSNYESMRGMSPLSRAVGTGQVVAPPGAQPVTSSGFSLFDNLIEQLQLPTIGIYTPWAAREGMTWDEVRQPPETNVLIAGLNDDTWRAAQALAMGAELPWIGILADRTPSTQEVVQALVGTAYEFFHTQAVYSQQDHSTPPTIRFLHWARLREPADPSKGTGSLSGAARQLGGQLVFAAQVNYDTSSQRTPPAMPFDQALSMQFPGSAPVVDTSTSEPGPAEVYAPTTPASSSDGIKPFLLPMAATAVAFGLVGYFSVRAIKQKKAGR